MEQDNIKLACNCKGSDFVRHIWLAVCDDCDGDYDDHSNNYNGNNSNCQNNNDNDLQKTQLWAFKQRRIEIYMAIMVKASEAS